MLISYYFKVKTKRSQTCKKYLNNISPSWTFFTDYYQQDYIFRVKCQSQGLINFTETCVFLFCKSNQIDIYFNI